MTYLPSVSGLASFCFTLGEVMVQVAHRFAQSAGLSRASNSQPSISTLPMFSFLSSPLAWVTEPTMSSTSEWK